MEIKLNGYLFNFLYQLPSNEPILFDVRNGGLLEQSLAVFETYHLKKKMFFYGYNGLFSLKEIKAYEVGRLKRKYKHPEFYGDFDFDKAIELRIKSQWQNLSSLNTYLTKEELLNALK